MSEESRTRGKPESCIKLNCDWELESSPTAFGDNVDSLVVFESLECKECFKAIVQRYISGGVE
jgi:hypothetical protein